MSIAIKYFPRHGKSLIPIHNNVIKWELAPIVIVWWSILLSIILSKKFTSSWSCWYSAVPRDTVIWRNCTVNIQLIMLLSYFVSVYGNKYVYGIQESAFNSIANIAVLFLSFCHPARWYEACKATKNEQILAVKQQHTFIENNNKLCFTISSSVPGTVIFTAIYSMHVVSSNRNLCALMQPRMREEKVLINEENSSSFGDSTSWEAP